MTDRISDERLQQLIAYAEQSGKPWLCVEVVDALRELVELRKQKPDTSGDEHG